MFPQNGARAIKLHCCLLARGSIVYNCIMRITAKSTAYRGSDATDHALLMSLLMLQG